MQKKFASHWPWISQSLQAKPKQCNPGMIWNISTVGVESSVVSSFYFILCLVSITWVGHLKPILLFFVAKTTFHSCPARAWYSYNKHIFLLPFHDEDFPESADPTDNYVEFNTRKLGWWWQNYVKSGPTYISLCYTCMQTLTEEEIVLKLNLVLPCNTENVGICVNLHKLHRMNNLVVDYLTRKLGL